MDSRQFDFLSGSANVDMTSSAPEQLAFWDDEYNIVKPSNSAPSYAEINAFFTKLNYSRVPGYTRYWQEITPQNDSEIFQRWLFAFMSVHTSWKSNVAGYLAIKDWWKWLNKWDDLLKAIDDSRVGMQNNRVRYISEFAHKFWEDPSKYKKNEGESWIDLRNRLKNVTLGLGPAKTSFALEMCYPNSAKLCCLDTHMFQAYGLEQTRDSRHYGKLESHWVEMSNMWNIPAYVARCLYWDIKQGYFDSRYWGHVFEKQ
jgi:hypothetical protein